MEGHERRQLLLSGYLLEGQERLRNIRDGTRGVSHSAVGAAGEGMGQSFSQGCRPGKGAGRALREAKGRRKV